MFLWFIYSTTEIIEDDIEMPTIHWKICSLTTDQAPYISNILQISIFTYTRYLQGPRWSVKILWLWCIQLKHLSCTQHHFILCDACLDSLKEYCHSMPCLWQIRSSVKQWTVCHNIYSMNDPSSLNSTTIHAHIVFNFTHFPLLSQ